MNKKDDKILRETISVLDSTHNALEHKVFFMFQDMNKQFNNLNELRNELRAFKPILDRLREMAVGGNNFTETKYTDST